MDLPDICSYGPGILLQCINASYIHISVYGLATCTLGGFPIKIKVHDLKTLHLLHAKQQLSVHQLRQWQPPKLGKIWDIATMHGKMLIYHIERERRLWGCTGIYF